MIATTGASELLAHLNFSRISFGELANDARIVSKNQSVRIKLLSFVIAFLNYGDDKCLVYTLQNFGKLIVK